jgi:adenylylsulfate kinase-like enzyme
VFDGDEVKAQLAHDTEKERRRRDEEVRRVLSRGTKIRSAASIAVRPIGLNACV